MLRILQWVSKLRNKKILEKDTLSDTMKHRGVSLWWFIRLRLYYDLLVNFQRRQYQRSITRSINSKFGFLFVIYTFFVVLISKCIFRKRSKPNTEKCKLFVTYSFGGWRPFRNRQTGKLVWGHSLFTPIIQELAATSKYQEIVSSYPIGLSFPNLFKQTLQLSQKQRKVGFIPTESYFTWSTLCQFLRARRRFSKIWTELKKNHSGDFKFGETNVFETFKPDFEYYYKFLLPLIVQYLELSIQLLKREHPDIILMKNEYSEFERALLYAAHFEKIPVIALQHGVIHRNHPGYQYNKSAISQDGSAKFPYAPTPSTTTVFGPYFKHILTEGSAYPVSRVEVTGQPRYDILHFADRIYDKQKFCEQFGINPSKKIVLIATQPFPVEKIRFEFLYHTTAALREIPDVQIIIKPHPNESVRWHKNHLESWNVPAVILPPQSETFAAIYACDLFVSVTSTTILEALILGKTVMVVNISNLPEILPWVEEGAAIGVYDPKDLVPHLNKALFDEKTIRQVMANRSNFVYNHTFHNDGKATDRVVSIIKKYCDTTMR